MDVSNMKNIIVVKNLPSNLVEEAIVILKSNKEVKKLEHIENGASITDIGSKRTKEYMVREAESVITNYISKIENNKNEKMPTSNIEKKYKKLKLYSIIASIVLLLSIIL